MIIWWHCTQSAAICTLVKLLLIIERASRGFPLTYVFSRGPPPWWFSIVIGITACQLLRRWRVASASFIVNVLHLPFRLHDVWLHWLHALETPIDFQYYRSARLRALNLTWVDFFNRSDKYVPNTSDLLPLVFLRSYDVSGTAGTNYSFLRLHCRRRRSKRSPLLAVNSCSSWWQNLC